MRYVRSVGHLYSKCEFCGGSVLVMHDYREMIELEDSMCLRNYQVECVNVRIYIVINLSMLLEFIL